MYPDLGGTLRVQGLGFTVWRGVPLNRYPAMFRVSCRVACFIKLPNIQQARLPMYRVAIHDIGFVKRAQTTACRQLGVVGM